MLKIPRLLRFKIASVDGVVETDGWESSHALGVAYFENGFASVMLMSGMILADGFVTVGNAHDFNLAVLRDDRLFVGTPSVEEFFERAGGREAAERRVQKLRQKISNQEKSK